MSTNNVLVVKPTTNGTPAKTETTKPAAPKADEKKPESIEDRLHRLNVLFDLQKKFVKWQETRKNLEGFEIAQNKENSTLELSDDEGNEFTTTNPIVIAEVVKLVLQVVNVKIKEVEKLIVF
jgi:hypothetical protein